MPSRRRRAAARGNGTVAEALRTARSRLTPAELRVAQSLLADYPAAGLQPVAALAAQAGVSGPTVVRLVAKVGFHGYAELQSRLRAELSARSAGPLERYPDTAAASGPLLRRFERGVGAALGTTFAGLDPVEFDTAVDLLSELSRPVIITGGQFSALHGRYLARSLGMLRGGVRYLPPDRLDRAEAIVEITADTVLIAFDYRRYDEDVVIFGRASAGAGATVVLLTDPYLSPLAAAANVLLTSAVDALPPMISLTPALAVVEALVIGVVERLGAHSRARLAQLDAVSARLIGSLG